MKHRIVFLYVVMLTMVTKTIIGYTSAQGEDCQRTCSGTYRFRPQIIDFKINNTAMTDEISIVAVWEEPTCDCGIQCYQVDILSQSNDAREPECSTSNMTNISENTLSLVTHCDLCIFQVSAKHANGMVEPGPCHFVNVTAFISMTHMEVKGSNITFNIRYESCNPGGLFIRPSYELNGVLLDVADLGKYIRPINAPFDEPHYFVIPNVTENTVLLEYCHPLRDAVCGICNNVQKDVLLSRSEVIIINGNTPTTNLTITEQPTTNLTITEQPTTMTDDPNTSETPDPDAPLAVILSVVFVILSLFAIIILVSQLIVIIVYIVKYRKEDCQIFRVRYILSQIRRAAW